ncbi:Uncharacterised protein [Raoultella terrigena]|uniref:Uncharacterized protein n=1 Tax=Raoultella terrigena TaxID=577 RepID=A0A3P8M2E6_RAOTE|nr:Uncharacterised protein [Raoultella terrigena]
MTQNEWIVRLRCCTSGETLEKVIEKIFEGCVLSPWMNPQSIDGWGFITMPGLAAQRATSHAADPCRHCLGVIFVTEPVWTLSPTLPYIDTR